MPTVNSHEDKVTQREIDLRALTRAKQIVDAVSGKKEVATLRGKREDVVILTTNPDKWKNK